MSEPVEKFKPSDLPRFLQHAMPYVATFGRAERELGAALYVEACRANGDTWQPVGPPMMGAAFKALTELDPIPSWVHFMATFGLMPDIHGLCDNGFFTKDSEHGPITPTRLFFERIARWVPGDVMREERDSAYLMSELDSTELAVRQADAAVRDAQRQLDAALVRHRNIRERIAAQLKRLDSTCGICVDLARNCTADHK